MFGVHLTACISKYLGLYQLHSQQTILDSYSCSLDLSGTERGRLKSSVSNVLQSHLEYPIISALWRLMLCYLVHKCLYFYVYYI